MLSGMLGAMRDMQPISALALAESFGLLDGKWKDFVEDRCTFSQRMIGGMNHGKFSNLTFGRNPATEPITNEFAALYLPEMIQAYAAAYETRTPLANNWMDSWERYYAYVMRDCVQTMYFSRWMRGHSPESNGLMVRFAEQLARFPLEWPDSCEAQRQIERLRIFVSVALRTRQCSPKHAVHIPLETRLKVIPWLKNLEKLVKKEIKTPRWRSEIALSHLENALANIKNSLMQYFDGEQRFGGTRDLTMHAEFKQRWDVCGAKSTDCGASNKRQLRECGKCHTVRYCCPEHQKEHWKEHESTCFSPVY
ncbi:hypothetical protein C8J57DRAFT_625591 [Mycena rebaudengoi]|nr:hypothetical protein C8J57DRAFT_625591 [Mycena rebaudengoi]